MYSYVYFSRSSSQIHHWYYDESGKKQYEKEQAPLYFYTDTDSESEYKSIFGKPVKKVTFDSWNKFKDAREMFKSSGRNLYESDVDQKNRYILDKYAGIDIKKPPLDVHFVDIEVHSEAGFPEPEEAEHPITIITTYSTRYKRFFVLTYKEFDRNFILPGFDKPLLSDKDVVKIYKNEKDMLEGYIKFVRQVHPDVISGWNSSGWETKDFFSNGFDMPYIINRINKVFDNPRAANELSPLGIINKIKKPHKSEKEMIRYDIIGINLIDYLALYRKYHQGEQETFKLDYIARVEIDKTKIQYNGSLKDLYNKDWQKYVEYNIWDVYLLKLIDEKIQFMGMMFGICYNCRTPFEQFSKTTRVLDGAFMARLIQENIVLPDPQVADENEAQYVGAYVEEPVPGIYDWVMSFDATSLYPSIMIQHNISPETKVMVVDENSARLLMDALGGKKDVDLDIDLESGINLKKVYEIIKEKGYSLASNGSIYTHEQIGVVARFVKEWFDKRKYHKKLMEKAQESGDHEEEKLQKGFQQNYKILINSVYGALGSKYFRLYDRDNATAVTLTGQDVIKACKNNVNDFFENKWMHTEFGKKLGAVSVSDVLVYIDTDSNYFNLGKVLKAINYPHYNDCQKGKEFMENVMEKVIFRVIESAMNHLTMKRMNCKENKIFFKREMIARRVAFLAKKYYSAWVLKLEQKDIPDGDEHELETKGHVMIKSTIPEAIRNLLKEFVLKLLKELDKKKSDDLCREMFAKFTSMPIGSICKISNVNNISKYTGPDSEAISGTPGHVKASINYNNFLIKRGQENNYELIGEGEKVHVIYIKSNPIYRHDAIAFKDKLPEELGLNPYINYDIMWEKNFIKPITPFYTILKWELPAIDTDDISEFFN